MSRYFVNIFKLWLLLIMPSFISGSVFLISLIHFLCVCVLDALKVNPYLDVKKETDVEKQDSKEVNPSLDVKKEVSGNGLPDKNGSPDKNGLPDKNQARTFTFHQLAVATDNFRSDCFLGEGGFGKVFKGYLDNPSQVG